jgi:hypothetical protein
MWDQIKEIFWFIVFILLAIYIVPAGLLLKKYEGGWETLWKKRDKDLGESFKFAFYLLLYLPNVAILSILENPWRDKISVYKL